MKLYLFLSASFLLCMMSCKKKHDKVDGLSAEIRNFVPQSVIDSMRTWGLAINEGKTPPDISGIYNFSRDLCTYDNSGYNRANTYFSDYRLRFRDQNSTLLTIALDYKALSVSDTASGVGSFIAGADNKFTVFVDAKGVLTGINYKQIVFYSGTKTANGIQNLQWGIYLKEKGPDPTNLLVKVGTSRIFKDDNNVSDVTLTYRVIPAMKALLEQ